MCSIRALCLAAGLMLTAVHASAPGCDGRSAECESRCNEMDGCKGEIEACLEHCALDRKRCRAEASTPLYRRITLAEAKHDYQVHAALFLDARPFAAYSSGTIMRALHLPPNRVKRMKKWLPADKNAPLLIFGEENASKAPLKLAARLYKVGYRNLLLLSGGWRAWHRRKLPSMGAPRKCRCPEGPYRPVTQPVTVAGVTLYPGREEGTVDARWIAPLIRRKRLPEGMVLVDVRPASVYRKAHIPGAINLPYDEETQRIDTAKLPADKALIFYCKHGLISSDAYTSLPDDWAQRVYYINADLKCQGKRCWIEP